MREAHFEGRPILITVHAIKRARQRNIAFPDQVYQVLQRGKVKRFGKRGIKFIGKDKKSKIICIGEIISQNIIIKTIERGR